MAYNSDKGPQHTGDIQYEGDPNDVQIDFENDQIILRTGGAPRVSVVNTQMSASGIFRNVGSISGSGDIAVSGAIHATTFYGSAAGLTSVPAATFLSGTTAQLTTGVETSGYLKVSGSSTLGDASGDTVTINAATVDIPNVAPGTDNTVVIYNGNTLLTDEIGPKVWAGKLVDYGGTPVANQVTTWSGGDTVAGSANLTFDGSILKVAASISGSGTARLGGSVSGSGDIAVSGAVHATTFYGSAAGLTGLPTATSLSGTTAQLTTGVETSGYLRVSGSTTLTGPLSASGNSPFRIEASISGSGDLALTGAVHAQNAYLSLVLSGAVVRGSSAQFVGSDIEFDRASAVGMFAPVGQPFISNKGYYSGSAVFHNDGAISSSADIAVSGAVHATTFYGDGSNLTGISAGSVSGSARVYSSTGVETSGYLKVSGSSTLGATTMTDTGSFSNIVATGSISGSGQLQVTSLTASSDVIISGNLGVGTANPAYDLHVNGAGVTVATIDGGAGADAYMRFATSGVEKSYIKLGSGGNLIIAQDATGGDLNLQAKPSGVATTYLTLDGGKSTVDVFRPLSGSGVITAVGSISSSGDLAVTGAVHATTFYGSAAGLTGITVSALSGTTAELTTGVETSGYLKVSGSTTLGATTMTGTGSFCAIVVTGSISGSGTLTSVGSISGSGDIAVSGAIHAANFYGDGSGLTNVTAGAPTSLSGTTAQLTTGVETSGYLKVTGSSTFAGSISGSSTLEAVGATTLGGTMAVSGNVNLGGANLANSRLYVRGEDAAVVAYFSSPSHDTIMAITGSGEVAIGGNYVKGLLNVSGSDDRKLIAAAGTTHGDVFYVSASGETFISGNLRLRTAEPNIYFSGSDGTILGQIGYNATNNIVLQNNFNNQHIVLKTTDDGVIKEGLRLDGSVPEVVVNQNDESLVNFRVESDNNTHMLYVKGSTDKAGINTSDPKTDWDVHHNPTTLSNDTGGGEVVQFGTGTTVAGKLYYLHSGSSWQQTDVMTAASGGLGMLAMALGTSPPTHGMLIRGFFDAHSYLSGTFVPGTTLYISAPGYITTMRPSGSTEILRVLGTCTTTANVIYFNPSPDYLVIV